MSTWFSVKLQITYVEIWAIENRCVGFVQYDEGTATWTAISFFHSTGYFDIVNLRDGINVVKKLFKENSVPEKTYNTIWLDVI